MRWKAGRCLLATFLFGACSPVDDASTEDCPAVSFFQHKEVRRRLPFHVQAEDTEPVQTALSDLNRPRGVKLVPSLYDDNLDLRIKQNTGIYKHMSGDQMRERLWQWVNELRPGSPGGPATLGSDIWNASATWGNVTRWHPSGVVSNVRSKTVVWAEVNYLSLDMLLTVSFVAYPSLFVASLLLLTVLTGVCMAWEGAGEETVDKMQEDDVSSAAEADLSRVRELSDLSPWARQIFHFWSLFCRSIPALLVFGTPAALVALTYPYPQEVFMLLIVVSSVMVFINGIYLVFHCPLMLAEMRKAHTIDFLSSAQEESVIHWVILPNYKEDEETLAGCLESIARSKLAISSICVLLAMEEREAGAEGKAKRLQAKFNESFQAVTYTMHPKNLPNDPPGKASNVAWAFQWLSQHVDETHQDAEMVLLTVADADSDFHRSYFEGLGQQFAQEDPSRRALRIWQAPVFHVKNYHRQPLLLSVGTMFTAMTEIAVLSDPNSTRFPYSTYSLSLQLARRVGGWDRDWIAEDWHMGIKCFLLTMGETEVHPVPLPTINYVPEDSNWWGTVSARWSQAKRHALGISDLSYYFQMMPLLYCRLSLLQRRGSSRNLQDFWRTFVLGIAYVIRLVNTHVVVGIMALYMNISFLLRHAMTFALQDVRHIGQLFDRSTVACGVFFCASMVFIAATSMSFQVVYSLLKDRMEPPSGMWSKLFYCVPIHWAYTLIGCILFSAIYCMGLAYAVWIAAVQVLVCGTFKYEVALKPTKATSSEAGPAKEDMGRGCLQESGDCSSVVGSGDSTSAASGCSVESDLCDGKD